jgi:DNA (cytosine-5)-methyltransferase 1
LTVKTYGSLFAGVGGIDLGFDSVGLECLFQVEIDSNCRQTLEYHWPEVKRLEDVTKVSGYDLPPVDIISFGSPCQDLSIAGKRAGLEGERSGLFHEAVRIIKEMREKTNGQYPKWAIWENVVGALSSNGGADFGQVLYEMDEAGACFSEWAVLDAQYFGVPQRRRRVFLISCFDPAAAKRSPDKILFVKEGSTGDTKKSIKQEQEATREITGCIRSGGNGGVPSSRGENLVLQDMEIILNRKVSFSEYIEDEVASTIKARDYKDATDLIVNKKTSLLDGTRVGDVRVYEEPVQTLQARMGTGGNTVPVVIDERTTSNISGTLNARDFKGVGNQYVQENKLIIENQTIIRRLTPLECERLMGWPDNHTLYRADGKHNADSTRYKMCGNGVASPVVKWIAEKIINI